MLAKVVILFYIFNKVIYNKDLKNIFNMSQENSLDNVMRKLRKLQKLYEGAKAINSEHEAENAAARIQELLTQYNLTMEQVGTEDDTKRAPVGHDFTTGYSYPSIGGWWEYNLTDTLCQFNYCKCFMVGKSFKNIMVVGEKHNIEIVYWLKEVLTRVFIDLSKKRWPEFKKSYEYEVKPICRDTFQRSYLKGCVIGLHRKLRGERAAEEQKYCGVTALVLKKDTAIQEYVDSNWKVGKGKKENGVKSDLAVAMGVKDGRNTNINKAVETTAKPRKQLS